MRKILFLSFLCFFIFSLISCSKVEETSSIPPFDYLRAFGGVFNEENSRIFPLKDGTFYVLANTSSPSLSRYIPKSMNKSYNAMNILENPFNIWLFQIDPSKQYKNQIIYSRCFGGSGSEELWAACLDENENIIVVANTSSDDGDVKANNNEINSWIFRVDPKKPYDEQITYSQTFPRSYMWIPLDIKSVDKDKCYLLYNRNENGGKVYSLMKIDFSKEVKQNPVFDRKIFFTNSKFDMRTWLAFPHIAISDKGIVNIAWIVEKYKLFSPFKEDELLNVDRNVNYKEENLDSAHLKTMDILVLSLNPNLPEKDWIVYSRIIGGSDCETFPRILKAENESFWISFVTSSEDGDMKDNIITSINEEGYKAAIALMKINPTLSKDEQIEYCKFLHVYKSFISVAPFAVCGDKLGFVLNVKTNDSIQVQKVDLTERQKEKNITLPYFKVEEFFERQGYCKLFILDTQNDKYYVHDLKVSAGIWGTVALSESSMFFSIESNCPHNAGDMPNYETSILEEYLNNLLSISHLFTNEKQEIRSTFSTELLVGKIDLENIREVSNTEKR